VAAALSLVAALIDTMRTAGKLSDQEFSAIVDDAESRIDAGTVPAQRAEHFFEAIRAVPGSFESR
jgi:hypothetical protein